MQTSRRAEGGGGGRGGKRRNRAKKRTHRRREEEGCNRTREDETRDREGDRWKSEWVACKSRRCELVVSWSMQVAMRRVGGGRGGEWMPDEWTRTGSYVASK